MVARPTQPGIRATMQTKPGQITDARWCHPPARGNANDAATRATTISAANVSRLVAPEWFSIRAPVSSARHAQDDRRETGLGVVPWGRRQKEPRQKGMKTLILLVTGA